MNTKQGQYTCSNCGKKLASQDELAEHGKTCNADPTKKNS